MFDNDLQTEIFSYTDVSEMPPNHRNAAQLFVLQYSPQEVAEACGMTLPAVQRMLQHPPFVSHVRALQARVALETSKQHERLMELFGSSMNTIEAAMRRLQTDVAEAEIGDVALILDKVLKVTNDIADRLPGRAFTKVARSEAKSLDVKIVDQAESNPARTRLRERMTELNSVTASAVPIEQGEQLL